MVRSASSRVSNHEARGPSFGTPRKGAAPQDEARPPRPRIMISTAAISSSAMQP